MSLGLAAIPGAATADGHPSQAPPTNSSTWRIAGSVVVMSSARPEDPQPIVRAHSPSHDIRTLRSYSQPTRASGALQVPLADRPRDEEREPEPRGLQRVETQRPQLHGATERIEVAGERHALRVVPHRCGIVDERGEQLRGAVALACELR